MNKLSLTKDGCGHPNEWNMRLVNNGKTYTYCMGCVVEKLGLNNLEAYNNPFIKKEAPKLTTKSVIQRKAAEEKVAKAAKADD